MGILCAFFLQQCLQLPSITIIWIAKITLGRYQAIHQISTDLFLMLQYLEMQTRSVVCKEVKLAGREDSRQALVNPFHEC